jgi:hypothetical protein
LPIAPIPRDGHGRAGIKHAASRRQRLCTTYRTRILALLRGLDCEGAMDTSTRMYKALRLPIIESQAIAKARVSSEQPNVES